MCLSILHLHCALYSENVLCYAVSLTSGEILSNRLVQTLHLVKWHQMQLNSALQLPIGLCHKTVFTITNRWISIIRPPLLRTREGMQGSERLSVPEKHMRT